MLRTPSREGRLVDDPDRHPHHVREKGGSADLERGLERRRARRCRTRRHLSFVGDPIRVGGGDQLG